MIGNVSVVAILGPVRAVRPYSSILGPKEEHIHGPTKAYNRPFSVEWTLGAGLEHLGLAFSRSSLVELCPYLLRRRLDIFQSRISISP